jgi:hypothetical protein
MCPEGCNPPVVPGPPCTSPAIWNPAEPLVCPGANGASGLTAVNQLISIIMGWKPSLPFAVTLLLPKMLTRLTFLALS